MDFIQKVRALRAVERTSAQYGFASDGSVDDSDLPDTGTLREQLAMAKIAVDSGVRLHDLSTRDQQFVRSLVRRCVLSPRPERVVERTTTQPAGRPRSGEGENQLTITVKPADDRGRHMVTARMNGTVHRTALM